MACPRRRTRNGTGAVWAAAEPEIQLLRGGEKALGHVAARPLLQRGAKTRIPWRGTRMPRPVLARRPACFTACAARRTVNEYLIRIR